tara:strand:+ start:1401 stop:1595 length:195 start_codon:yes stop_codon:yes gene_type:complete
MPSILFFDLTTAFTFLIEFLYFVEVKSPDLPIEPDRSYGPIKTPSIPLTETISSILFIALTCSI